MFGGMETRFGDQAAGRFFGGGVPDYLSREKEGKRSLEWDLNDWKWDGGLFIASPLKSVPGDCRRELVVEENQVNGVVSNSSSSCSEENEKEKRELEKRRRVLVSEDSELNGEAGNLTLKLGEHVYPITESEGGNWDERNGKKSKLMGAGSNRAVCQVQNCGADLSTSKDYHRRHKVCEMHSKAGKALVGNAMQRFCQQCSRFHLLQEFDEGKRSCRRRLAGHNKRRRKTNPETAVNGNSLNDDSASSYLLISLLKILSNMHSNNPDQTKNQDLLSHLLKNLASNDGTVNGRNVSGLLQEYQDMPNIETSTEAFSEVPPGLPSNGHGSSRNLGSTSKTNGAVDTQGPHVRKNDQLVTVAATNGLHDKINLARSPVGCKQILTYPDSTTPFPTKENPPAKVVVPASSFGGTKINNFDLNSAYNDMQDCSEGLEGSLPPASFGTCSPEFPPWMQKEPLQSSPPHTSGNSDSASTISPSSSSGSGQSRTDRIVFKLFGKDPSDFPHVVRAQILDWLSHSPTDIESYIRPGCIVLTIYLRLAESTWQELSGDLTSSLSRLLNVSDDPFWKTGWAYTEVQDRIAFIYSGQVVLDIPLPLGSHNQSSIITVTPIAVSVSERAQFTVKGFNLSRPTTRLLCALEGKYLLEEATHDILENDTSSEEDELQCFTFPCSIPDVPGRGFIEVEDHGLSSGFFPFIVAEQDVCSEIRMLESIIEVVDLSEDIDGATGKLEAKNQALDFIHEMGWLIHRSRLRSRVGHIDPTTDVFPFPRFKWLIDFSMDRDWCAVVNKLLKILFEGTVGSGDHSSVELALSELCLLHRAVRRSSRPMVELLLRYAPNKALMEAETETRQQGSGASDYFFRPDAVGPAGLTPLHIAASRDGSEDLVDALTNDPGLIGVEAWKNIRDNTGSTPEDYARLRGHYSYIHLVHKKIKKKTETGHVILDIPADLSDYSSNHKSGKSHSSKVSSLQIEKINPRPTKIQSSCKACDYQLAYGSRRSMVYRPAMLSLLAIAAVCVCVALLFKSSPEVLFVYPFRWEFLDYGSI